MVKKQKEKWYNSRRVKGAIITAVSAISLVAVELGYMPESLHLKIGQIVGCLAGTLFPSASWLKPKKINK